MQYSQYNYHRYYDPATGRYITSDPIGLAGGLNIYGYAGQNPIVNVDPDGLLYMPTIEHRPPSINSLNFSEGLVSALRAQGRLLRFHYRKQGLAGRCEKNFAEIEAQLFGLLSDGLGASPEARRLAREQALEVLLQNKAKVFGRAAGNAVTNALILRGRGGLRASVPLGAALTGTAGMGDIRRLIELSVKTATQTTPEQLVDALIDAAITGNFPEFDLRAADQACGCQ